LKFHNCALPFGVPLRCGAAAATLATDLGLNVVTGIVAVAIATVAAPVVAARAAVAATFLCKTAADGVAAGRCTIDRDGLARRLGHNCELATRRRGRPTQLAFPAPLLHQS
jgi:hypothetical protein